MAYLNFFLSGCNLMLLLFPNNKTRWINGIACIACFIAGLICADII